jgi:pimeloyl-ACP methyl ester carboxylesterase
MTLTTRRITTTDGLSLAVQETGSPDLPTVVAVHGYPDDHHVWDGVVAQLAGRFRIVTYDVRGAGESDRPRHRSAYRLAQLADDLRVVLDAVSPDQPVHLLAHDWGSIQCWEAVTDPWFAQRLASYTSISGPSLDMVGVWMRRARRHPRPVLRQLIDSYYVAVFQLPWLPELAARAGVLDAAVRHSGSLGRDTAPVGKQRADIIDGIQLYRANFAARLLRPYPRATPVPVLVLAPTLDAHVDSEMQRTVPAPWVARLETREISGNHWVVEHSPDVIAAHVEDFITSLATPEPVRSTR